MFASRFGAISSDLLLALFEGGGVSANAKRGTAISACTSASVHYVAVDGGTPASTTTRSAVVAPAGVVMCAEFKGRRRRWRLSRRTAISGSLFDPAPAESAVLSRRRTACSAAVLGARLGLAVSATTAAAAAAAAKCPHSRAGRRSDVACKHSRWLRKFR